MNEKIQAYQRVIDANHRQSLSSKEQEILELRRAAEEERRVQNERITQLEHMVQVQMQHNLKLQSMLDSQFAQVRPSLLSKLPPWLWQPEPMNQRRSQISNLFHRPARLHPQHLRPM